MTLLNRPSNGYVASMVAVWRTMRHFGPMTRARLISLCGVGTEGDVVSKTYATWGSLGMFGADGRLVDPFSTIGIDDIESLRTSVFDLLMQARNCPRILEDDDEDHQRSLASDFVRVSAWALAQDPYLLSGTPRDQQELNRAAQAQGMVSLWSGDGRWIAFQEWAHFCGLGMPTVHGFVMNPARAIREALRHQSPTRRKVPQADIALPAFIAALAKTNPLLEGGVYRSLIDDRISAGVRYSEGHEISPCTSLALLQLHHEGELVLVDAGGDVAAAYTLVGRRGAAVRRCSHVRRRSA